MNLQNSPIVLYLTPVGFQQLSGLLGLQNEEDGLTGIVKDTDGFAIYVALSSKGSSNVFGIPWHLGW